MSPARLFLFLLSLEFIQIFFSHFFLIFKKTGIAVSCLFNDSSHVHRRGRRVIYSFNPPRSALSGCKRRSGIIRPGSHSVRMSMNVVNERIKVNLSNWMKNFIVSALKNIFGSNDGSIGRAFASDTRDPRFESQHWQSFIYQL